jgi:hypothetical protein
MSVTQADRFRFRCSTQTRLSYYWAARTLLNKPECFTIMRPQCLSSLTSAYIMHKSAAAPYDPCLARLTLLLGQRLCGKTHGHLIHSLGKGAVNRKLKPSGGNVGCSKATRKWCSPLPTVSHKPGKTTTAVVFGGMMMVASRIELTMAHSHET